MAGAIYGLYCRYQAVTNLNIAGVRKLDRCHSGTHRRYDVRLRVWCVTFQPPAEVVERLHRDIVLRPAIEGGRDDFENLGLVARLEWASCNICRLLRRHHSALQI